MSRGPVIKIPPRCTTLELKDLADTIDFDLSGEVGSLYGFEYTDEGFYKRSEIDDKKAPKLEQLKNVKVPYTGDYEYKIRREDNKWHITPIIDWDIMFEFTSPYILFDFQRRFRKALNKGPLHVSLIAGFSREKIEIQSESKQYFLHKKDSVSKDDVQIEFFPETQLADNFTLVFILSIRQDSLINDARGSAESKLLLGGIHLNWNKVSANERKLAVVILKANNPKISLEGFCSNQKVDVTILPSALRNLNVVNISHFDLLGLYYTDVALPKEIIEMFVKSKDVKKK